MQILKTSLLSSGTRKPNSRPQQLYQSSAWNGGGWFYLLVMERGVKNIHISLLPKDIWIRASHFHGERPKQLTREYPEVVLSLLQLFLA